MAYYISDRQNLASSKERSKYKPFSVLTPGCRWIEALICFGHPLFVSMCDIFVSECISDSPVIYPIIPDGCLSVIFYGDGAFEYGTVCGTTDRIKKLTLIPGWKYMIFRFMPGASAAFLKCDINDITNNSISVEDGVRNGDRLISISGRDLDISEKALQMSRILKIDKRRKETDYLIRYCTENIFRNNGNIMIADLSEKTGFSDRYLGKIFEKYIGISPKTYAEIIRLQSSLYRIFDKTNHDSLMNIALDSGYFDHAHMNRNYNKFLFCSSGELRKKGFSALDYSKIEPYIYSYENDKQKGA